MHLETFSWPWSQNCHEKNAIYLGLKFPDIIVFGDWSLIW
jgi:hypothetical protein